MKLDLFSSKHRPGGRSELLSAADSALSALRGTTVADEEFSALAEPPSWAEKYIDEDSPKSENAQESEPIDSTPESETDGYRFESNTELPNIVGIADAVGSAQQSENDNSGGYTFEAEQNNALWEVEKNQDLKLAGEKKTSVSPENVGWVTPADLGLNAEQEEKPKAFNPFYSATPSSLVIFRSNDPENWKPNHRQWRR